MQLKPRYDKVIFLDVDGVICIRGKLQRDLVLRLKQIVDATGAKIVLSSNWRHYDDYRAVLSKTLENFDMEYVDATENIQDARPYEIYRWILRHRPQMIAILDDRDLAREKHGFRVRRCMVKTETQTGLTDRHVTAATSLLNSYYLHIGQELHTRFIYDTLTFDAESFKKTRWTAMPYIDSLPDIRPPSKNGFAQRGKRASLRTTIS
jgi:hypothetical protein